MKDEFKKIQSKRGTRYVLETATSGATSAGAVTTAPASLGMLQKRLKELKQRVAEMSPDNAEYNDEAGMADNNLETLKRAVDGLDDIINAGDNLPEWCQEKIAVAKSMLVTVWDYMQSEEQQEVEGVAGGLAGGAIGAALTKTPSGAAAGYKIGSAAQDLLSTDDDVDEVDSRTLANYIPVAGKTLRDLDQPGKERRSIFMAKAAAKLMKNHDGKDELEKQRLKRDGVAASEDLRDPKDNPCWKGYHPVGTKKKAGKTVPNCVPKNEDAYTESLAKKLAEKIPPGASVDYYMKDFSKSTTPQFRGKSQAKRREMAIAAHYAAQQPKKTKKKK